MVAVAGPCHVGVPPSPHEPSSEDRLRANGPAGHGDHPPLGAGQGGERGGPPPGRRPARPAQDPGPPQDPPPETPLAGSYGCFLKGGLTFRGTSLVQLQAFVLAIP